MTMLNILNRALQENQIKLTDEAKQKLIQYLHMLTDWNRVFNLTSITDEKEMVYLHIIDSLLVQPFLQGKRMLDVGSGAGLPGIPLAIANPEQQWVLLDKNNKKTRFLTQVIAELSLSNVSAVHSRCEDFQPESCFDNILSRAFGTLRLLAESTAHLLCKNGRFIAMKGKYPQDEINDLPQEFLLQKASQLDIKGMNIDRHVICLSKSRG